MTDQVFTISSGTQQYQMFLPNWETDYIQGLLAKDGVPYEHAMLQAMQKQLAVDDIVLDVGANIGNHTLFLANVVGCRVIAFEPNPALCQAIRRSVMLNKLDDRVVLHEVGVGKGAAKGYFTKPIPENLGGQSLTIDDTETSTIKVISLDSLNLADKVRAIKIDVEGMEEAVLKGAQALIARDLPYLFVEAQTEADFEALHNIVVELGYVYWDTFNATPTHWFIHKDEVGEDTLIEHYFEKGRDSYKLRLAKREIQEKLNQANKKYRSANLQIDELKVKCNTANEKYRAVTAKFNETKTMLDAEIKQLKSQLAAFENKQPVIKPSTDVTMPEFDFSIQNDREG